MKEEKKRKGKEKKRKGKEEKKKKRKSVHGKSKGKKMRGREKGKGRKGNKRFSRCSDYRSSIVRKLKLVIATRATRGYRNPNFLSKLQEVRVFSFTGSSLFKSHK